jgi:hypothetical protein
MCADVMRALSDGFWRAPGGITTALRLGMKLANERLIELNRGAPQSQQARGSLSCIVVKDQSLVMAQAGPAIAYARSQGGAFERIEPPGRPAYAGVGHALEPHYSHFAWQPGDIFVLTGQGSRAQVDDALIEACMAKGDARLAAGYLNANVKRGQLTGVAVSVEATAAAAVSEPADDHAPTPVPVPIPPTASPAAQAVASADETQPASTGRAQMSHTLSTAGMAATAAMSNAARSVQRSLRTFGAQLLPARPTAAATERSRATLFLLVATAVLIPIVVAVAVGLAYYQLSGEAERQQLRNAALAQVESAKAATDPAEVKQSWSRALDAIAAYETRQPDDQASFGEDKNLAYTRLDQASRITRITPVTLATLAQPAGRRRVAAASLGVYVLDSGSNAADHYVLNAERTGISGKPLALSMSDVVTGAALQIKDIAWATPGNDRWRTEGALLFAEDRVMEYSSATTQVSPIALPDIEGARPGLVTSGELYNGTIYILDAQVGQIWRYTYQANQWTRSDTYFRSPFSVLRDAVDFAIDGAIYVLSKNGSVSKYFGRAPVTFNVTNLPVPLGAVTALAASGTDQTNGNVYIADTRNGAVFMLSKSGEFLKQFRAAGDAFIGLHDMAVDATSNTVYVVTPTQLYSFKGE